jgi:hypothetical protein
VKPGLSPSYSAALELPIPYFRHVKRTALRSDAQVRYLGEEGDGRLLSIPMGK